MLVINILDIISKKKGVSDYTQISLDRWVEYQCTSITKLVSLDKSVNLDKDIDFQKFYVFLNSVFSSKVNRPTAVKIMNNAYFM